MHFCGTTAGMRTRNDCISPLNFSLEFFESHQQKCGQKLYTETGESVRLQAQARVTTDYDGAL